MKKVNRLRNRIEPFAALFWALGNVLYLPNLTLPTGLVSLHRRTQGMSLYGQAACTVVESWFNSKRRRAGHPPFPSWSVIYL